MVTPLPVYRYTCFGCSTRIYLIKASIFITKSIIVLACSALFELKTFLLNNDYFNGTYMKVATTVYCYRKLATTNHRFIFI